MKYMKAIILASPQAAKELYWSYAHRGYLMDDYALKASDDMKDVYLFIPETYLILLDNVKFDEICIIGFEESTLKDLLRMDAVARTIARKGLVHIDEEVLQHIPFNYFNH